MTEVVFSVCLEQDRNFDAQGCKGMGIGTRCAFLFCVNQSRYPEPRQNQQNVRREPCRPPRTPMLRAIPSPATRQRRASATATIDGPDAVAVLMML